MNPARSTGSPPSPMLSRQVPRGADAALTPPRASVISCPRHVPVPPPMPRAPTPFTSLMPLPPGHAPGAARADSPPPVCANTPELGPCFAVYEINQLFHGIEEGVLDRITGRGETPVDLQASCGTPADAVLLAPHERLRMSQSWYLACTTGEAVIHGEERHTRICAVTVQHFVEAWLAERLNDGRPFTVVAAIHTPAPATPLRQFVGMPVTPELMADHQRADAGVGATVSRRAGSIRDLLAAGATVYACYSQAGHDALAEGEQHAYATTRHIYPNLVDAPRNLPREAFDTQCGATYLFGENRQSLTGCFAIRLPQAADAQDGAAEARLIMTSSDETDFDACLDELESVLGLQIDPSLVYQAARHEPDVKPATYSATQSGPA